MIVIWYRIYCKKQKEEKLLDTCRQHMSKKILKEAFVFTYDRMRRFQGEWHLERQLMFPDYVFLESGDETALEEELMRYRKVSELFRECENVSYVEKNEEKFLVSLCGKKHHLGMSRGVIRDGITRITEGPLLGMEERIRKVDRHKRLARLEIPGSRMQESILAGLEIIDKR